jgi:hypothetical protein
MARQRRFLVLLGFALAFVVAEVVNYRSMRSCTPTAPFLWFFLPIALALGGSVVAVRGVGWTVGGLVVILVGMIAVGVDAVLFLDAWEAGCS